jgi:hypothetical protein
MCLEYQRVIPDTPVYQPMKQPDYIFFRIADYRFHQGLLPSLIANSIQPVNFLGDRFLRKNHLSRASRNCTGIRSMRCLRRKKPFGRDRNPHPALCADLSRMER